MLFHLSRELLPNGPGMEPQELWDLGRKSWCWWSNKKRTAASGWDSSCHVPCVSTCGQEWACSSWGSLPGLALAPSYNSTSRGSFPPAPSTSCPTITPLAPGASPVP